MGLIKNIDDIGEIKIKFKLDDEVCFIPEGTHLIKFGKIVRIQADIWTDGELGKQHVTYTIQGNDSNRMDVTYKNVYASKDELFEANGLHEFDCEVYFDRCSSLSRRVIAKTLEDAIASLKEEYPNAYSIREVDHWK